MLVFGLLVLVHDEVRVADHPRRHGRALAQGSRDGLAAAEKGQQELAQARDQVRGSHPRGARARECRSSTRRSIARTSWSSRRRPRRSRRASGWSPRRSSRSSSRRTRAREELRKEVAAARGQRGVEAARARDRREDARRPASTSSRRRSDAWPTGRTIARPYAKAAFADALEQQDSSAAWSEALARRRAVVARRAVCASCSAARTSRPRSSRSCHRHRRHRRSTSTAATSCARSRRTGVSATSPRSRRSSSELKDGAEGMVDVTVTSAVAAR